jgi:hypothetical protein
VTNTFPFVYQSIVIVDIKTRSFHEHLQFTVILYIRKNFQNILLSGKSRIKKYLTLDVN